MCPLGSFASTFASAAASNGSPLVLRPRELSARLDLHDFEIGNRGLEFRVPVDEALVLVDQPLVVELHENLHDGLRQALVHREAFAAPVAGRAEALQLIDDGAAGLVLPRPDALQEFLAAKLAPRRLLVGGELALDDHLRRDAGVVGARLPEHVAAAHALEAHENILQRVVEGVPHMERARHVRRRDHDRIGSVLSSRDGTAGLEGFGLVPFGIDARLDFGRAKRFFKHLRGRRFPTAVVRPRS